MEEVTRSQTASLDACIGWTDPVQATNAWRNNSNYFLKMKVKEAQNC